MGISKIDSILSELAFITNEIAQALEGGGIICHSSIV